jgi:hypothetical protein
MENDNGQPLLVAGALPKTCYSDFNEFVRDLAKVLRIPTDTIAIIQGAQGEKGEKGQKGSPGAVGPAGPGASPNLQVIPIPLGATYVDFDHFEGYKQASYSIHYNGMVSDVDPANEFDPTDQGTISVAQIVEIYPGGTGGQVRAYFTGGPTFDDESVLHIMNYV